MNYINAAIQTQAPELPKSITIDQMQWTVIGVDLDTDEPFAYFYRAGNAESAASQVDSSIRILGIIQGRHTVMADTARCNDGSGYCCGLDA